jgi:sterol desaturase/sphingolipid hydroxylase (fatty acid hydroxylase superfamily)
MNTATIRSATAPGFLAWLLFPALLTAVALGSLLLLAHLPPPVASLIMLVGLVLTISGLERLTPQHRAWNARPEGLDLLLIVFNRLVDAAVIAGTLALAGGLQRAGLPRLHAWPAGAPLLLQALLGITLAEGIRYALHRASHRPGLLWRIHRIHHQPGRMYALNGPRLHPGNQLWVAMAHTLPMLLLGAPLPAVFLTANVTVFFVLFQHANLRLRFDGWNRVLATPDVHRLHHRREASSGVNYGIVLLVFDRLFGTYRPAREVGVDDIGLAPSTVP